MARQPYRREALRDALREIFDGRRLLNVENKLGAGYLVIDYEANIEKLRRLARRAKELEWGEVKETSEGVSFRLLTNGIAARQGDHVR